MPEQHQIDAMLYEALKLNLVLTVMNFHLQYSRKEGKAPLLGILILVIIVALAPVLVLNLEVCLTALKLE